MTKGAGQAILDLMIKTEVLDRDESWYFLDPNRLADLTGTTYQDCMARNFGDTAVSFVLKALEEAER